MHECPLIFTAESIRAMQAGAKVQTRRLFNPQKMRVRLEREVRSDPLPECMDDEPIIAKPGVYHAVMHDGGAVTIQVGIADLGVKPGEFDFVLPWIVGKTHLGDYGGGRKAWTVIPSEPCRIWTKETWRKTRGGIVYRADEPEPPLKRQKATWHSPLFLKRKQSRITREVLSVRIERLQDITEVDARAEGVTDRDICAVYRVPSARDAFWMRWDEINEKRAPWNKNPLVARIEFSVTEVRR